VEEKSRFLGVLGRVQGKRGDALDSMSSPMGVLS